MLLKYAVDFVLLGHSQLLFLFPFVSSGCSSATDKAEFCIRAFTTNTSVIYFLTPELLYYIINMYIVLINYLV